MTDKELSAFGEKLYEAILMTPLPAGMVFAIATAIRQGIPWPKLAPPLKLAVFKIAANCNPGVGAEEDAPSSPESGDHPQRAQVEARGDSGEQRSGAQPAAEIPDEGPSGTAAIAVGDRLPADGESQDASEPGAE